MNLATPPKFTYGRFGNTNDFSTSSESSSSEYSPQKRPKKTLDESASEDADGEDEYEDEDTNDPSTLLRKLLTMVKPKCGKATAVRAVVRALKTSL